MIITVDNVIPYLLEKNLIDIESIVDGDINIIDVSRRNRNIKILRKNKRSYLLKQSLPKNHRTLQIEAYLYRLVQTDPDFNQLSIIMPLLISFDSQKDFLITEMVKNGQSMRQYNRSQPKEKFDNALAGLLGKVLATYHNIAEGHINSPKLSFFPRCPPSALFLPRPGPELFSSLSAANVQLVKIIQQYPELLYSIDELRIGWRIQTLIHGDIRSDNVIISSHDNHSCEMKVVDWETASIGDPAWDIGGAFQDFISFWVFSLPLTGEKSPEEFISTNDFILQNIQAALRKFWYAYIRTAKIDDKKTNELLIRSTKYCAVRLIQTAFESSFSSMELSNSAIYILQLSLNILCNQSSAIAYMLGIPFVGDLIHEETPS